MKERFNKIVIQDEKGRNIEYTTKEGMAFVVMNGQDDELILIPQMIHDDEKDYTQYSKPPIPIGYEYFAGKWNKGFIIKRTSDGSEFVWIPVGCLDCDGTLDGHHFFERFGRRNFNKDILGNFYEYHEIMDEELLRQLESVKKYGGFYISRYNISKSRLGEPQSVMLAEPWVDINFHEAKKIAESFEKKSTIQSHLLFGTEYDSVLAWLIKSGDKKIWEVTENSTNWGNYINKRKAYNHVIKTGEVHEYSANNIYDLAGNVDEWTQEWYGKHCRVIRGGCYFLSGNGTPVSTRNYSNPKNKCNTTGFRIALWIK